jgi:16S rRNA (guanine966-N2)-methyltransferase
MRIVGGTLRSRALKAPRGESTRPTSDKVRQALFDVLGPLDEVRVLDLWSGSGALAFEAISRGAASAVCVESARHAVSCIEENAASLGLASRVTVVGRRIEEATASLATQGPFELVLADPPWALVPSGQAPRALAALIAAMVEARALDEDALVVLEHAARDPSPSFEVLTLDETRVWGDTAVSFYRPTKATPP